MEPRFYKEGGARKQINTNLTEDKNAGDSDNVLGRTFGEVQSWVKPQQNFTVTENDWNARFAPSDFDGGMLRIRYGGEQVGFSP